MLEMICFLMWNIPTLRVSDNYIPRKCQDNIKVRAGKSDGDLVSDIVAYMQVYVVLANNLMSYLNW